MIVLDYLRPLENDRLVIPPFHTGHLGFLPNTDVTLGIVTDYNTEQSHCELIIAPFEPRHPLAKLVCTMRDEQGVVGRLVRAVSKLGINIVTQESSSLDSLEYHRINMLLDWYTTKLKYPLTTPSSLQDRRRYRKFAGAVPVQLQCYLVLLESIIEECADCLWFHEFGEREPMPALAITPLSNVAGSFDQLGDERVARLERGEKSRVNVPLHEKTLAVLKRRLDLPVNEKPHYLLASDTESKTLRAFFPAFKDIRRLVHLGFSHQDAPGALDSLLEMIRRANFFVITSLLRQSTRHRNSWEVILEYRGKDNPPSSMADAASATVSEEVCKWAAEKLVSAARTMDNLAVAKLAGIDVKLGPPEYPRAQNKRTWTERLTLDLSAKSPAAPAENPAPGHVPQRFAKEVETLKDLIRDARSSRSRPKIFLSYSDAAAKVAANFRKTFNKKVEFLDYHDHKGEAILTEVIERIRMCDGFIGIWWHEDPKGDSTSPWLPFEYGIATADGAPCLIVHSPQLKAKVWQRVEPNIAAPAYDDKKKDNKKNNKNHSKKGNKKDNNKKDNPEALSAVERFIRKLLPQY